MQITPTKHELKNFRTQAKSELKATNEVLANAQYEYLDDSNLRFKISCLEDAINKLKLESAHLEYFETAHSDSKNAVEEKRKELISVKDKFLISANVELAKAKTELELAPALIKDRNSIVKSLNANMNALQAADDAAKNDLDNAKNELAECEKANKEPMRKLVSAKFGNDEGAPTNVLQENFDKTHKALILARSRLAAAREKAIKTDEALSKEQTTFQFRLAQATQAVIDARNASQRTQFKFERLEFALSSPDNYIILDDLNDQMAIDLVTLVEAKNAFNYAVVDSKFKEADLKKTQQDLLQAKKAVEECENEILSLKNRLHRYTQFTNITRKVVAVSTGVACAYALVSNPIIIVKGVDLLCRTVTANMSFHNLADILGSNLLANTTIGISSLFAGVTTYLISPTVRCNSMNLFRKLYLTSLEHRNAILLLMIAGLLVQYNPSVYSMYVSLCTKLLASIPSPYNQILEYAYSYSLNQIGQASLLANSATNYLKSSALPSLIVGVYMALGTINAIGKTIAYSDTLSIGLHKLYEYRSVLLCMLIAGFHVYYNPTLNSMAYSMFSKILAQSLEAFSQYN